MATRCAQKVSSSGSLGLNCSRATRPKPNILWLGGLRKASSTYRCAMPRVMEDTSECCTRAPKRTAVMRSSLSGYYSKSW